MRKEGTSMNFIVLIIYAVLAVGGLTCFKLGSQNDLALQVTGSVLSIRISWLSLLGMLMYVCSFLVYLSLIAKSELSYITPVASAVVYILTMVVSFLVLHESFDLWKCLGIIFILCGVIMMNLKK